MSFVDHSLEECLHSRSVNEPVAVVEDADFVAKSCVLQNMCDIVKTFSKYWKADHAHIALLLVELEIIDALLQDNLHAVAIAVVSRHVEISIDDEGVVFAVGIYYFLKK